MGGRPKGLLAVPGGGQTIVERSIALARDLGAEVCLVGAHPAYEHLAAAVVPDAAPGKGPLGGLVSLLEHAAGGHAIALGCDMPRLTAALLERLAGYDDGPPIVAPRQGGRWSPLFARYDSARVLESARARLERGDLALQPLLDAAGARELTLSAEEHRTLEDWDTPEDIARS